MENRTSIILPQQKKIIRTPYRDFDEVMAAVDDRNEHGIDMFCDITITNKKGKVEGTKSFECHSFVSNFVKLMAISLRGGYAGEISAVDICGEAWTGYNLISNYGSLPGDNWLAKSWLNNSFMPYWSGPIVGTGTTAAAVTDYWMEKPVTHGSEVENLTPSNGSGSVTAETTTYSFTDNTKSWSTNAWRYYLCKMTSGAANGRHFIIWTNTSNVLTFRTSNSVQPYMLQYSQDRDVGSNYQILTYGQLTLGDANFTTPTTEGSDTTKLTISRDFTNSQGTAFAIHEFGLQVQYYCVTIDGADTYADGSYFLIVRDVDVSGVTIQDGEKMTLTYRIITVV